MELRYALECDLKYTHEMYYEMGTNTAVDAKLHVHIINSDV